MVLRKRIKQSRRRGLATRLTWAFVALVGTSLLVVGLLLTFVSYNAQVEQLTVRQQKTADEAAVVTSAYLTQVRDVLALQGQVSSRASLVIRSFEIQEEELLSVLDRYGDVFAMLALLDADGDELARVTASRRFSPSELSSQASSAAFQQAIQGEMYIGDQVQISDYSALPVILMAGPMQGGGRSGVLVAEVNIEGMWDAVAQVEVGESGYAYIVNHNSGQLIAHSSLIDYLYFQEQSMEQVPIVRQLMAGETDVQHQYQGLAGEQVIGATAALPDTEWTLVVELPTTEALADLRQMLYLLAALIVVGVAVAAGLGVIIPRRIVQPLSVLREGAEEIGAGRLDHVMHVETGDEIQDLAEAFNQMAASLKTSRAELERWAHELEDRVEERTQELAEASARTERRATQLQTSAEVARATASVRDLDRLLPQITQLISERFGWHHVGIFLLDETGEYAVLRATNSEGGQRMLARGHRLKVGETGIVGYVTSADQPRIALDVGEDAVYFDNPDLPETRSEMALPLTVGDQIIGALDVQSTEPTAYDNEDVALLSTLADQVAIAIQNARQFERTQKALEEVQTLHRRYVQQEWAHVTERRRGLAYEYRRSGTPPLPESDPWTPEATMALTAGKVVALPDPSRTPNGGDGRLGQSGSSAPSALAAPIKLRDQIIGVLDLQEAEEARQWTDDEIALIQTISDQVALALENVRLLEAEQTQRMAAEALREAAVVLSGTLEPKELIQSILDQIGQVIPSDARNLMLVAGDQIQVVSGMGYERFGAQALLHELRLPMDSLATIRQMRDTGHPVVISDTATYPGWMAMPGLEWLRSYVGAPIIARGQLVGVMNVDSATPGFFTQEHADQLEAFASQAAIALQNSQLLQETRRRAEQLATLHAIGLDLSIGLELERVLETLYDQCRQVFVTDSFYVALYDESTGLIRFPMMTGKDGQIQLEPIDIHREPGVTGHVIQSGQPLYIPDVDAVPEDAPYHAIPQSDPYARSYIGVPLTARGRVMGVLSVQSYEPNAYTEDDVGLLKTIATQASIAIENARAYERLVETTEQLRELDRLKTQFLANMSHELRTPLNSIIGFSRVMLKGIDGPLTELQEADLSSIYNSGQHLLSLINSILDMSKIEAGKMDLSFDEVVLSEIFDVVISTTGALLKDQPIEMRSEVPDDLPTVWADAQRVRQVLTNLMSNAVKFTQDGHITLRAEAGPEFVTVSVNDTGIGIEPEAQKRLFIPFQQVDASTTRRAGGTGLGLAISHSFVQMHGGEIWVESEPDKGSTFFFTLPVYQVVRKKEEEGAKIILDPAKKLVLAIDDDAGVITLLKRYLEHEDYQVIGVMQSRHALEMAQRLAPNLTAITLDVVMPHVDGWQILRSLKRDPQVRDIPVILCSIVEGLEQGLGLGAAACLRKPVTRDEVVDALKRVEHRATRMR
jgi:signal transduction histidine kinase/ActR/RegA family two-component response regulator